jgi:hypothetical protein
VTAATKKKALGVGAQGFQKHSADKQSISLMNYTGVKIEALLQRAIALADKNLAIGTQMQHVLKGGAA